ncbi:hypothetical protein SCHPADRAFT_908947 [Schizopora paradoxa]|uniref:F-box domain-containing protein n=1 Tax=Schizopora paradoxa TaxID=27342 RepID=A0A0H2R9I2_9AGAM|nr:hypothetical protein SCHPADRAFT_908947 [Schizopora paradoxa]
MKITKAFQLSPLENRNAEVEDIISADLRDPSKLSDYLESMTRMEHPLGAQCDAMLAEFSSSIQTGTVNQGDCASNRTCAANARKFLLALGESVIKVKRPSVRKIVQDAIRAIEVQAEALGARYGFSLLPDDLLQDILLLATGKSEYNDTFQPGRDFTLEKPVMRASLILSHTCQRFRSIVLDSPQVWNAISDQMKNPQMLEFCLTQSRGAPLDIGLNIYGYPNFIPFAEKFKIFLASANRWRSFTLGVIPRTKRAREDQWLGGHWHALCDNLLAIDRMSAQLHLPLLHHLDVGLSFVPPTERSNPRFHSYTHWSMPSLTSIHFRNCVPMLFPNRITHFSLLYHQNWMEKPCLHLRELANFLHSCGCLEDIELRLADSIVSIDGLSLPVVIPNVTRASLSVRGCGIYETFDFCRAFQFRDAIHLHLGFEYLNYDLRDVTKPDYEPFISQVLALHPQLTSLDLSLEFNRRGAPFKIPPIAQLHHLKELTLECTHWDVWEKSEFPYGYHVPPLVSLEVKTSPIGQRTGHWDVGARWTEQLISRLESEHGLERFALLTISTTGKMNPVLGRGIYELLDADKIRFVSRAEERRYPHTF